MTPEHELWIAVLTTYRNEAICHDKRRACTKHTKKYLISQLETEWTQEICSWVGVDYGQFKKGIIRLIHEKCTLHV